MSETPKQIFDVYRNKAKSTLRLATLQGAGLPRRFPAKDWSLLKEPTILHTDAPRDVAVQGYCYFELVRG